MIIIGIVLALVALIVMPALLSSASEAVVHKIDNIVDGMIDKATK